MRFCLKLLNDYGHYLGLPAPLELITDDDDLWNEFVQQQTSVGRSLSGGKSRPAFAARFHAAHHGTRTPGGLGFAPSQRTGRVSGDRLERGLSARRLSGEQERNGR